MLFRAVGATALVMSVAAFAHAQVTQSIPLTTDTFIDSSASMSLSAGYQLGGGFNTVNYGADAKVKVVSSATVNKNSNNQVISYTHTLFQIPQSIISAFSSGTVTDVTLNYFPVNDSLSNPYLNGTSTANPNYDGDGVLDVYPLSKTFNVGNGQQSPAVAATAAGATWGSPDGLVDSSGNYTNPWTTPGGDYDSTSVPDTNSTLPLSGGAVPFTWDITSLLNTDETKSDLEMNGGLIRLPNEPVSNYQLVNETQDFTSLNSADTATASVAPYFLVTYATPEPTSLLLFGLISPLMLCRKRSLSCDHG